MDTKHVTTPCRELTKAQVHEQAMKLADFVRRGGSASRWLDSKQFLPADRAAILLVLAWTEKESAA